MEGGCYVVMEHWVSHVDDFGKRVEVELPLWLSRLADSSNQTEGGKGARAAIAEFVSLEFEAMYKVVLTGENIRVELPERR